MLLVCLKLNDFVMIFPPIIAGKNCYHALDHLLKKRYITHSLRTGLYQTTIGPLWPMILNHGP